MEEVSRDHQNSPPPPGHVAPTRQQEAPCFEAGSAPGHRERSLAILVEHRSVWARSFDAMERHANRIVSPDHPTHIQLERTLKEAGQMLGLRESEVRLVLFAHYPRASVHNITDQPDAEAYLPEAYVNPCTGTVYLSIPLLEACAYNTALINSVMYHELAHMILMREPREELLLSTKDPLGKLWHGYEVEYHCDRVATLLSSKRGEDPESIGKALKAIQAELRKFQSLIYPGLRFPDYLQVSVLNSHPTILLRIRANQILVRQLPVAGDAGSSTQTVKPIDPDTLPITRPCGHHLMVPNSFDNRLGPPTNLPLSSPLLRSPHPRTLCLTAADYRNWIGEAARGVDTDVIPLPLRDLLLDPSVERVSDWLREFVELASSGSDCLLEVVEEFNKELAGLSLEELAQILSRLNSSRFIDNSQLPDNDSLDDTAIPFCLSVLLNRYLQIQTENGASAFEILSALADISLKHEREFGHSVLPVAPEISLLVIDVCVHGNDSEKAWLVDLIGRSRSFDEALGSDKGYNHEPIRAEARKLLGPIFQKYSPLTVLREELSPLVRYSLCAEIVPLGTDDAILQPTVLRRTPGGSFDIKVLKRAGGLPPVTMVQMGDGPLSEADFAEIRRSITDRFTDRYQAKTLAGEISDQVAKVIRRISTCSEGLLQISPPTQQQLQIFITSQLALCGKDAHNTTSAVSRLVRDLSQTSLYDCLAARSLPEQIYRLGEAETKAAWVENGRMEYSRTSYASPERSSFFIFQVSLLFNDLYRKIFDTLPSGVEKADFLLSRFPIKALERDQLLCAALGYPELSSMNDMKAIEARISSEADLRALHILRDSLSNTALAQIVEVQLYKICCNNQSAFLTHPTIAGLLKTILEPLPSIAQKAVANDNSLQAILSAFTIPSRERDGHLRKHIDRANSQPLKEALGTLLVDPIVTHVTPDIGSPSRAYTDSLFSLIEALSPYDKAQALLYFMGWRDFESPIATWFGEGHTVEMSLAQLQKSCTLKPLKGVKRARPVRNTSTDGDTPHASFQLPDCLVRAQKIFGISIATAENLQSSLLNERTITDLLSSALFGETGIVVDTKVRREFFRLAARALLRTSENLGELSLEQRKALAKFIAFAFERCPHQKLPTVIMRVWEGAKGEKKQLPTVLASILSGLGPAFVKFGQKLATTPHIPPDYKSAFRNLSSQNTAINSDLFLHNSEAILGRPVFDRSSSGRKLGEGSMAATFLARPIGEAEHRAVKVIHPFNKREIDQDCAYIAELVSYINQHKPLGSLVLPHNTAAVIRQQLYNQIDTEREADRNRALRENLRASTSVARFVVPAIDESLCTKGIFTTMPMLGYELDEHCIDRQGYSSARIRNEVGLEILRLLLIGKVYQSDVNLGNFGVLYDPSSGAIVATDGLPTIVWYDSGAVEQINPEDQKLLLSIIKSAGTQSASLLAALRKLVKNGEANQEALAQVCLNLASDWRGSGALTPAVIKERFEQFFDKVSEAGLEIEERWLVVANTISMAAPLLEGVGPDRLQDLVMDALTHHQMLAPLERMMWTWFSSSGR